MALHDYTALDEADFYGQGFCREGVLSLWVGLDEVTPADNNVDCLQDLCGVGYYDGDAQESNSHGGQLVALDELLEEISFSTSFKTASLAVATARGISEARWVIVQYDFAYDPSRVKRPIQPDPVFLGVFEYVDDA